METSGKAANNSQRITEGTFQTLARAGGISEIQGRLKIMQDPRDDSGVLVFFHCEFFSLLPSATVPLGNEPYGTKTQAPTHSPWYTGCFWLL